MPRSLHLPALSMATLLCLASVGATGCSEDPANQDMSWQIDERCKDMTSCVDMDIGADMDKDLPPSDMSLDQVSDLPSGMALVPEGPFLMGTTNEFNQNVGIFGEAPVHEVYLSTYAIDIYEVSVKDYQRCVTQGACTTPKTPDVDAEPCNWGVAERADHPINCVDWFQSKAYCQWAGKVLPTEAQLEKAARGPDSTLYPWGNEPKPSCEFTIMHEESRMFGCGTEHTWPVGSRPKGASVYGVMDLLGNVQEWPSDLFDRDYYGVSEYKDPQGPADGSGYAPRGGHFRSGPLTYPYSSQRKETLWAEQFNPLTGFRCAKNL
jgi:formylglycine-generating enzyme